MEEVNAFLKAKAEEDAPLSMEDLENSAGGACNENTTGEVVISVIFAGVLCAIGAIVSAASGDKHVGQQKETEGRICSDN